MIFKHSPWHGIGLQKCTLKRIGRGRCLLLTTWHSSSSYTNLLVSWIVSVEKGFYFLWLIINNRCLWFLIEVCEVKIAFKSTYGASTCEPIWYRRYCLKVMIALHGTWLTFLSVTFIICVLRSLPFSDHIIILCHLFLLLNARRSDVIASLEPLKDHFIPVILKFDLLQLLTEKLVLLLSLEVLFIYVVLGVVVFFRPLTLIQLQLLWVILATIASSSIFILLAVIIILVLLRVTGILRLFRDHRLSLKDVICSDRGLLFLARLHKHIVIFRLGV